MADFTSGKSPAGAFETRSEVRLYYDCLRLPRQSDIPCSLGSRLRLHFRTSGQTRGCDPDVLAKIRTDVFDIPAPKP